MRPSLTSETSPSSLPSLPHPDEPTGEPQQFGRVTTWFFWLFLVVCLVELGKSTVVYLAFGLWKNEAVIYGETDDDAVWHFLNFLMMPESAVVTTSGLFTFLEYWRMVANLIVFSGIVFIFVQNERRFMRSFGEEGRKPLLFLLTLSVQGFPSQEDAETFVTLMKLQHPTDDVVVEETFVYDLESYRNARFQETKDPTGYHRLKTVASTQEDFEVGASPVLTSENLLRSTASFTGKAFVVFNDPQVIRRVLDLNQAGLLLDKVLDDIDRETQAGIFSEEERRRLVQVAMRSFDKLRIEFARDPSDIHFRNIEKDPGMANTFKFFLCLLVFILFFAASLIIKYFATTEDLMVEFGRKPADFTIPLGAARFPLSWTFCGMSLVLVLVPLIGSLLLQLLLSHVRFHFHSSAINASLWAETSYQALQQFLAIYVGYTTAVFQFKNGIDSNQLPFLYYVTNRSFCVNVALFVAAVWLRFAAIKIIGACARWRQRKNIQGASIFQAHRQTESIEIVEHSFYAANIVISFFCLFFFQYLMSPLILLTLALSLGLNCLAFARLLRAKTLRVKLFFQNICSLILLVLLVSAIGCLVGTMSQFHFSFRYFCQPGYTDNYFPMAVVTAAGALLVYCPILFRLTSTQSFSSRLLDFLIERQGLVSAVEHIEETVKAAGFRRNNSWDREFSEIASKLSF